MAPAIDSPVATEVAHQIRVIRGQRVLLDAHLASLYGVSTKVLNQAVRRNTNRFSGDFLLSLSNQDVASLRSQIVTLKTISDARLHRARRNHGCDILNSDRAVEMSVYVVRAFVKTRELLASNTELARELTALKKSVTTLDADTRRQFDLVYEAILGLTPPDRISL